MDNVLSDDPPLSQQFGNIPDESLDTPIIDPEDIGLSVSSTPRRSPDTPIITVPLVADTPIIDRDDLRLSDPLTPLLSPNTPIIDRDDDIMGVPVRPTPEGEAVYRLFNNELNLQFYTTSEFERDTVLQDLPQYESQGVSFIAAPEPEGNDITGISPVYRLFNSNTGAHLYTISEAEKDSVVENLPNYNLEGIEYYGYETQIEGTIPLYRFYNPSLDAHFYTPSVDERDEYIDSPDFQPEGDNGGIAFYVQPAPEI